MAENSFITGFKVMVLVQLFYSFGITGLAYAMPDPSLVELADYQELANAMDLSETASLVEDSLTQQTNIPVLELGSLVFYSGNIIIDLVLNFAFALPQMLGLLIHGISSLLNLDPYIWVLVQLFSSVLITVLYLLGIIQLLTGIRSGTVV